MPNVPTYTNIAHVMGYLPDRTLTAAVADDVYDHLSAATTLIQSYVDTIIPGVGDVGIPEPMLGEAHTDFISRSGVESSLLPEYGMFRGLAHKDVAIASSTSGEALTATILMQPVALTALLAVTLYAPSNAALTDLEQDTTLRLYGVASDTTQTLLSESAVPPLAGAVYRMDVSDTEAYPRYLLTLEVQDAAKLSVSRLDYSLPDLNRYHLKGIVPAQLSEATARFAAHLYYRAARDGNGKGKDTSGRSYAGAAIPVDIRAMLKPYRSSGVMFI